MACLENRVKNTLAYFCAFDSTKSTESVQLDSGVSPSKSRSIQELLKRIRTFSQFTWFAKPDWLSPVNCARLGWQNIDVDLLECITCKTILSAKLPSSHNLQVYDECCKRLQFLLENGHHNCCPWKSGPTASDLCRLTFRNRSDELQDFISRVQGLTELKSHLPIIEDSVFTCLKLTMDEVVCLCHLVADISPCTADVDYSVLVSACVLALCGWHISTSASCSELMECKFCDRKIGLWNYFSQDPAVDQETLTTMLSCYDDSELTVSDCMEANISRTESPFACDLIAEAEEMNDQLMNKNLKLSDGEGSNGRLNGVQTEQSSALADKDNPASRLNLEEKDEEGEDVPVALTGNVQLEFPEKLEVTDISYEVLVSDKIFNGSEKEQILDEEDVQSIQSLSGATDVPSTANALCSTETLVADEKVTPAHITSENAGESVNQDRVVLNDTEFDIDCEHTGKRQDDNVFGSVEVSQEYCAECEVECCEEESANMNLMCSVEGLSGKQDLSEDYVRTSDIITSSGNSFNASTVSLTQNDSSDAGVGCGSVRDDQNEDGGSVSYEAVMGRQREGELTERSNALASETLPSMSSNISLASDSQVTDVIYPTSASDKQSGSEEVQLMVEVQLQCGPAAAASAAGLGSATDNTFEERSNNVPEKLMESDTIPCNRNLYEGNLLKSESNGSNKPDINDLPTNHQLINQLTEQQTVQPDQPTTQQADEPTNQPTDQLMEQLIDQPTATSVPQELQAYNSDNEEPCVQGSMKRISTSALEESKVSIKRRCLARPVRVNFNPVAEHHPWCIWVRDAVIGRYQRMTGGNEEEEEDGTSYSAPQQPWIRLFYLLLQSNSPDSRDVPRALSVLRSF